MVYPEQVLSRDTRDERAQCLGQSEASDGGAWTNERAGILRVPWIISAMKFLLLAGTGERAPLWANPIIFFLQNVIRLCLAIRGMCPICPLTDQL